MVLFYSLKGEKMIKFDVIAKDIIEKEKFQSLKDEKHHGLNRYEHVMRVARNTYKISRLLRMDYISATRGALLHDYFNDSDYQNTKGLKKGSLHPVIALNNARREHELNSKEENIIISHMFPLGKVKPNCKESWVVTSVDKVVAIYECTRFKFKERLSFAVVLLVNFLNF